MKKLYITDLDGTLLDKNSQVSNTSSNIINNLIKEGVFFTYATARSYKSSSIITKGLNINLPVIIYNGAFIYDIKSNRFLHKVTFNKEQIRELIDFTKKHNYIPLVYTLINGKEKVFWNCNGKLSEGFNYYLSNRQNDRRMTPVNSIEESFCGDVFYVTFIESHDDLLPLYNGIKDNKNYNTVFQQEIYREEYWCEIMPSEATKANAALKLKEILNCKSLEVFGDSLNDIPMFNISDRSYAVMNSVDKLKSIATEVIGYNYEDSVALKLKELENKI